jgi:hypothetical protein
MQKIIKSTIVLGALIGASGGYCENQTIDGSYTPQPKQLIGGNKVLPPKYLSVPQFKKCLSQKDMGTYKSWCLPEHQPKGCPDASWERLKYNKDQLPYCTKAAEYQNTARTLDTARPSGDWTKYLTPKDNKLVEHILKQRCDFKGSLDSTYTMNINTKWCNNAGFGLIDRYKQNHHLSKKTKLSFNNNSFTINQTFIVGA